MKNILTSILGTRALVFVLIGFCTLVGYQHLDIQNKNRQLERKNFEISKLEIETQNYKLAQQVLERDVLDKKEQARNLAARLAELENLPITRSCGPSVHKALEILRDQNN